MPAAQGGFAAAAVLGLLIFARRADTVGKNGAGGPTGRVRCNESSLMTAPNPVDLQDRLSIVLDRSALRAVDRAMAELRRGDPVLVEGLEGALGLALAAEAVTSQTWARLPARAAAEPMLVITPRRAALLGLAADEAGVVAVRLGRAPTADQVRRLIDPGLGPVEALAPGAQSRACPPGSREAAAVQLAKLARLLPAALVVPVTAVPDEVLHVRARDIADYQTHAARTLRRVAEARVPLADAENTRVIAFRPSDGGLEHLAIVIGDPAPGRPVLARLHSECFTGDLLGSLRCDCGDQLRGAIAEIARQGSGVLLYLAQEGRGIGLVNKLRAYQLQDTGFDTVDANEMLGFDADERVYLPAAEMLRQLGFAQVRLMTNNPDKMAQLARCGIEVVERVPHIFPSNGHNEAYLRTKAERSGHLF